MFERIITSELEAKGLMVEDDFIITLAKGIIESLQFFEKQKHTEHGRMIILSASKKRRYFIVVLDAFKETEKGKKTLHGFTLDINEVTENQFLDKLSEMNKEPKNVVKNFKNKKDEREISK